MHEFILAERVVKSALEYADNTQMTKVNEVEIEIGELLGISNESFRLAYATLAKNTLVQGAKVKIRRVKGDVRCVSCGYSGNYQASEANGEKHMIDPVIACPKCGSPLRIDRGNECRILGIS